MQYLAIRRLQAESTTLGEIKHRTCFRNNLRKLPLPISFKSGVDSTRYTPKNVNIKTRQGVFPFYFSCFFQLDMTRILLMRTCFTYFFVFFCPHFFFVFPEYGNDLIEGTLLFDSIMYETTLIKSNYKKYPRRLIMLYIVLAVRSEYYMNESCCKV